MLLVYCEGEEEHFTCSHRKKENAKKTLIILKKVVFPHLSVLLYLNEMPIMEVGLGLELGLPYSGYFLGGKIFVVFVVERQTTKLYP